MAGTVVETLHREGPIKAVVLTCVGDAADGTVPATAIVGQFSGRIVALETNPGTPAPTANYDLTLTNENGYDVLQALGANRHTSTTERVSIVYSGTSTNPEVTSENVLTLNVTNQSVNSAEFVVLVVFEGSFVYV